MTTMTMNRQISNRKEGKGLVYCLICTHTVEAELVQSGRKVFIKSGQKCPRCTSSLDAGYVMGMNEAA